MACASLCDNDTASFASSYCSINDLKASCRPFWMMSRLMKNVYAAAMLLTTSKFVSRNNEAAKMKTRLTIYV